MPDLRAFLVRMALDDAFRDLVRRDPDAAFTGYALDEAQREALRHPDEGWLSLLGGVVRAAAPEVHSAVVSEPEAPSLPEARLLLALRPHTLSDGRLGWGVTLHSWPTQADADALRFLVRVTPRGTVVDGALRGTYAATIQPAPAPGPDEDIAPGVAETPRPSALAHAEAVRSAPPAERYARLRDLLAVVGDDA